MDLRVEFVNRAPTPLAANTSGFDWFHIPWHIGIGDLTTGSRRRGAGVSLLGRVGGRSAPLEHMPSIAAPKGADARRLRATVGREADHFRSGEPKGTPQPPGSRRLDRVRR